MVCDAFWKLGHFSHFCSYKSQRYVLRCLGAAGTEKTSSICPRRERAYVPVLVLIVVSSGEMSSEYFCRLEVKLWFVPLSSSDVRPCARLEVASSGGAGHDTWRYS